MQKHMAILCFIVRELIQKYYSRNSNIEIVWPEISSKIPHSKSQVHQDDFHPIRQNGFHTSRGFHTSHGSDGFHGNHGSPDAMDPITTINEQINMKLINMHSLYNQSTKSIIKK